MIHCKVKGLSRGNSRSTSRVLCIRSVTYMGTLFSKGVIDFCVMCYDVY